MLLDKDNQLYFYILIWVYHIYVIYKSGSTYITNSFIHKRYRNIGLTTWYHKPRNLYTFVDCLSFFYKDKHYIIKKT